MHIVKGHHIHDSWIVTWSGDSSYLGQGEIMEVDTLTTIIVCVVCLAATRPAEVYHRIYPANMIQQLILLKIENAFRDKNIFYFITINE